jgi:hypothetical protein
VLASSAFWGSWRVEVCFFLVRTLYALTAFPFLAFRVPIVRTLLSHTFATGYTRAGVCVPTDTSGLSALASWLQLLLSRPSVAALLTREEREKLEAALSQACECLHRDRLVAPSGAKHSRAEPSGAVHSAAVRLARWLSADYRDAAGRPPPRRALTEAKRKELLALLLATVPPSHPLFSTLFAERQICREYEGRERLEAEKRRAAQKALAANSGERHASWDKHQGAKFGVEWQPNAGAPACTLCGLPFTWSRRRHHCRLCGRLVCDACSRARMQPVRGSDKPERACDRCKHGGEGVGVHETIEEE